MGRRFTEALRRAEIIELLHAANDEQTVARILADELCQAYDAEIAFAIDCGTATTPWRLLAVVGLGPGGGEALLEAPEAHQAVAAEEPIALAGEGLLGIGARAALLYGVEYPDGRGVVVGVARLFDEEFADHEIALIQSVTRSAAHALERLWARAERDTLIDQLKQAFIGTAQALANALEAKDNYTADHAEQIAAMADAVGRELGMAEVDLEGLRYGAIFHDIGKIAVPDAILHKRGPLSPEERLVIERHPQLGEEIISPVPFLGGTVAKIVRHDHERWDGTGYPDKLAGDAIPLGARIVFVVDAYHAMVSDRPYRAGMPHEKALEELRKHSGSQFDPAVVEAFLRVASSFSS